MSSALSSTPSVARPAVGRHFRGNASKLAPLVERLFPDGVPAEAALVERFGLSVVDRDLDSDVLYAVYFADTKRVVVNTRLCLSPRIRRFAVCHEIGHHLLALGHAPWARGHAAVEAFCDGFACLALPLPPDEYHLTLDQL